MASSKPIQITQMTETNIKNVHDHMRLKYMFEPVNANTLNSISMDRTFMTVVRGVDDEADDNIELAMMFLSKQIETFNRALTQVQS